MTEPTLTDNARTLMEMRYSRKGPKGEPTETPGQVLYRVALNVASTNALYAGVPAEREEGSRLASGDFPYRTAWRHYNWMTMDMGDHPSFVDLMHYGWRAAEVQAAKYLDDLLLPMVFLPNSPTFTGAGTPVGQLSACFVLPVEDDLAAGPSSIFSTMREAAAIQQTGGGNGFDFSSLRPRGVLVKKSMGAASGPVSFMRAYDATFASIGQAGTRSGANMGIMRVDHPDIEEFIHEKTEEGRLAQFNISVTATDDFMEAVEKGETFELVFDGEVFRTVEAADLFGLITSSAWRFGDPGVVFIDTVNRDNPCPHQYTLVATNPCGEQPLPPHGSCNLGSIAIQRFVTESFHVGTGTTINPGTFDWVAFGEACVLATEFLDDVIDANAYVPTVPRLEEMAEMERRIGLGGMGLADALVLMGIRYGSAEARDFAAQVCEWMRYHAMVGSIGRAQARGPFPWITGSIYDPMNLTWTPPEPLEPYSHDFGRPEMDWGNITKWIEVHGIRNATQLTWAPTGTISNVSMCEGSGCEPIFALTYTRTVTQFGEKIPLNYASALFDQALTEFGLADEEKQAAIDAVAANQGSCQGVAAVPEVLQRIFAVAADVTVEEHVRMQAVLQAFTDQAISKTINAPKDFTVADVAATYKLAHELGCKGITIYRQGSREVEVLTTVKAEVETAEVVVSAAWPLLDPVAIPASAPIEGLPARVFPVETFFGKVQVTITELLDYDGRPFDVRLQIGKGGNDKNADVEAIGRTISIALRAGLKVEHIVSQLENIGGATTHGFGEKRVRSVADGVAKLLRRLYLPSDPPPALSAATTTIEPVASGPVAVEVCPECHQTTLVMASGCAYCSVAAGGCGYEMCG